MKKREYMKDCFMNDDLFIAHLEQRAKDGWLLVSMNDFILTYKLTESQTLKFQIDYNEVTNEYKNILNDLGYTLTAIFDGKYVYYNKNINAEDLYNDEKTILMAKSHQFRISKIVHSFVWTFIFLTNFFIQKNDSLYMIYQFSLSQLLTNTTFYYIMTFFLLSGISYLFTTFYQLIMRRYYQKCLDGINPMPLPSWFLKSHKYIQMLDTIFLISFFSFLFTLVGTTSILCYLIFIDVIILFTTYYSLSTHQYYYKFLTLLCIVLLTGNIVLAKYYKEQLPLIDKPLFYQDNVDEVFLRSSNDLFVNQQFIIPYHYDYYERYAICLNTKISNILFKQEIIELERETRKDKLIDEYQQLGKQYDESLYPLYSYNDALKNMKSYSSSIIDQAYYNDKYFICTKDNLFLSFQITDEKSIDEILAYYFSIKTDVSSVFYI